MTKKVPLSRLLLRYAAFVIIAAGLLLSIAFGIFSFADGVQMIDLAIIFFPLIIGVMIGGLLYIWSEG